MCTTKNYSMKMYVGMDVYINIFFTTALVGGGWSVSRFGCFNDLGKRLWYPLDGTLGMQKAMD
jgi:hypothetical protein